MAWMFLEWVSAVAGGKGGQSWREQRLFFVAAHWVSPWASQWIKRLFWVLGLCLCELCLGHWRGFEFFLCVIHHGNQFRFGWVPSSIDPEKHNPTWFPVQWLHNKQWGTCSQALVIVPCEPQWEICIWRLLVSYRWISEYKGLLLHV